MRTFLFSLIRMRQHLITANKSGKNAVKCHAIIKKTMAWLNAYPKATEEQVRNYAQRNSESIRYLIPSGSNPAHQSIHEHFNTLIHAEELQ